MKIKYDLSDNYFKYYNEACGVSIKKKQLKNDKGKLETATFFFSKYFVILFLIGILLIIFNVLWDIKICLIFGELYLFASFFSLYMVILTYFTSKSKLNSKIGEITINKDGISDKSNDGKTIAISWNNLDLVVVTKNTITILSNSNILYILDKKKKEDIIKEISKYSNIKIIDKKS